MTPDPEVETIRAHAYWPWSPVVQSDVRLLLAKLDEAHAEIDRLRAEVEPWDGRD